MAKPVESPRKSLCSMCFSGEGLDPHPPMPRMGPALSQGRGERLGYFSSATSSPASARVSVSASAVSFTSPSVGSRVSSSI